MCRQGKHHHGECNCNGGRHGEHHEENGCDCNCYSEHERECSCHEGSESTEIHFERRFLTRAEQIAQLEVYLNDLKVEAQAVEERITEMKAVGA
jgi:CDP-glycerol glycerophosphotransferase (TagB/SpsB family)